jgi:PAS domain S-box-containing protein
MVGLRGLTRDVTERKRAEEALRESAARLRLAQVSAGAGIWDWDIGTGRLEWSEELFRLFGLDPATHEASFESWRAVVHPDDRRLAAHRIEAAVADHASLASEYRIVLPSGEVRWISALGHATYDPDGAPRRMSGICIDISERMRVEETLRQSEERYRTLFESMAEGFALHELIVDDQGKPCDYRFLEVNPAFGRLTGLDPRAIVGRTVRQVIPTVEPSWIDTYGAVVRTGESVRFERYLAAVDRWYDVFAYSPAPGRFATAFTDITARKGAEAALRQSREDLDRAQEVGQVGSWRLDVRRNVLTWSDENYRIFGAPAGTPQTYNSFLETIHPDDREYVDAMWSAALRGEPYDIEHRIVVHGQVKWVREKAYLELDEAGALRGGFGITQDITDRKLAEQQLRESLAEKELLLREIHHRVKNNLQVVSSLVSLQADALTDPRFREVFNDVRNRVRSMGLVHEKLYQSGGLSRLDFADYAAGLTRSLWNAHGAVGARVKLQLEVEPVALSVATAVPCGLILNELVSNALKHAFPSGGGKVTVGLAREPASGRLCLRVVDDGVGLPAGFDWRHARSLGLRLVQMLAAQLDGSVEAGAGPGTEFRVSFVAKEAEGGEAPAAGESSPRNDRRA